MTRDETFKEITEIPEFAKYPNYKVIKHRHKTGELSEQFYTKLFRHFGYIRVSETWKRQDKI